MFGKNKYITVCYTVESDLLKKDFKIAFLTDLHNRTYGKGNEQIYQDICMQNPDAVLIAGDMITARDTENPESTIALLVKIASEFPVWYAFGNHESKMKFHPEIYGRQYEIFYRSLEQAGVRFLLNKSEFLEDWNIMLSGLEISGKYYSKTKKNKMDQQYLEHLLDSDREDEKDKKDKKAFNLLLAHNPEYFKQYAEWGANLVLSGHIHGGMIRFGKLGGFISPSFRLFPYYDGGRYDYKKATMILSRGLGMHTIPIRIANPCELVIINLCKK